LWPIVAHAVSLTGRPISPRPLFWYRWGMKSRYLTWELVAAVGLAAGLGASWWVIALVSFVACGVLALNAMWGKRNATPVMQDKTLTDDQK
jgi:hypothetical protein